MNSDAEPITLEEFLGILKKHTRIVEKAFKRLSAADKDRFMGRVIGIVMGYIRSAPDAITDIVSQIRNSLTTVEEKFDSGFQSEEFREALLANPAASKKIDAYYDIVQEGTERLNRIVLYLPQSSQVTTGEAANVAGVSEEMSEYAESSASRVKAARDNNIISNSSLHVESIPSPTKIWSITLQTLSGTKHGSLTPREFYFLLYHCQARRSMVKQAMTRGCCVDTTVIDNMPDGPRNHLQSIPYAWMGDPRVGRSLTTVADQQSKMKSAVNSQVSAEIIIYEEEHYSLNSNLSLDRVHIPALKLP